METLICDLKFVQSFFCKHNQTTYCHDENQRISTNIKEPRYYINDESISIPLFLCFGPMGKKKKRKTAFAGNIVNKTIVGIIVTNKK